MMEINNEISSKSNTFLVNQLLFPKLDLLESTYSSSEFKKKILQKKSFFVKMRDPKLYETFVALSTKWKFLVLSPAVNVYL